MGGFCCYCWNITRCSKFWLNGKTSCHENGLLSSPCKGCLDSRQAYQKDHCLLTFVTWLFVTIGDANATGRFPSTVWCSGVAVSTIASQQDGSLFQSPGALPGFSWDSWLAPTVWAHVFCGEVNWLLLCCQCEWFFVSQHQHSTWERLQPPPRPCKSTVVRRGVDGLLVSPLFRNTCKCIPSTTQLYSAGFTSMSEGTFLQVPHDDLIMFMQNSKTQEWSTTMLLELN